MIKIIAALLCILMLASSVVSASALKGNSGIYETIVSDYVLGDANNDGAINAMDSLEIKKY